MNFGLNVLWEADSVAREVSVREDLQLLLSAEALGGVRYFLALRATVRKVDVWTLFANV